MEIPKIVEELLADKVANNNTIDLDAYANGLLDMYQALQLHKTQVSGSLFYDEELFIKLWYSRNPCHELNSDTQKDMFWKTAFMVFEDYKRSVLSQ